MSVYGVITRVGRDVMTVLANAETLVSMVILTALA